MAARVYKLPMDQAGSTPRRQTALLTVKFAFAAAAFAAASGAAFAAWIDNGPQMLMSMAASGLAWCF